MKRLLKITGIIILLLFFIGNILPNLIGVPWAAYHSYQTWQNVENSINQDYLSEANVVHQSHFKNGIWIHEKDARAGIEIKNDKWVMFYEGTETDSTDIYDYKIITDNILLITNHSDTLKYKILDYSDEILSLMYLINGKTHIYTPKK